MPLFDEGGHTGASYQTVWEAFTGLFDKESHGKPDKQDGDDERKRPEDDDDDRKRRR